MISEVITNIEAFNITILRQLFKQILIEFFKVVLDPARVDGLAVDVDAGSDHVRALVHVGEENGGADAGFGVEPGATIAMSACSDLEVEWAIHSVFLCAED